LVNVADALAPLPPEEPEIFLQQSKQKNVLGDLPPDRPALAQRK
jgi:hypothetical protein